MRRRSDWRQMDQINPSSLARLPSKRMDECYPPERRHADTIGRGIDVYRRRERQKESRIERFRAQFGEAHCVPAPGQCRRHVGNMKSGKAFPVDAGDDHTPTSIASRWVETGEVEVSDIANMSWFMCPHQTMSSEFSWPNSLRM